MDKYEFYFEQLISEENMDNSFTWAEEADWATRANALLPRTAGVAHGVIHVGAEITQNAPSGLSVIATAGACTDPTGRNVEWAADQVIDCSLDYLGASTAVAGSGNERYLGIFAFFDQSLTDQVTDGNGALVYSKINESVEFKVYQGTEAAAGTASPPATPSDSIRLANVKLAYGTTLILDADIYYDIALYLRDDYVRVTGVNLSDFVFGNPSDALEQLFSDLDSISDGLGITFTGNENWHDASGVLSSSVISDAINEIVEDLAEDNAGALGQWGSDKVGSDAYPTANGNADLTRGSISDQLREIADTLDDFVETYSYYYVPSSDLKDMITTKLWDNAFSRPSDAVNTISGGATRKYVDIKTFFTAGGGSRLLVLDNSNKKIEVWNPKTLSLVRTTNALTDDLPSGSGQTWQCIAMCTDGTNVYVAFTDTNASPDTHQVQAWTIDLDNSDWSVKSGWPSTGTALTATGNGPTNSRDLNIIIANSSKLAVASCCQAIASSSSEAITIINISDGSIASEGAGDSPTGTGEKVNDRICSDGTYIYFTVNSTGTPFICSAAISDATTGCGGTGYPRSTGLTTFYGVMCSCGSGLIITVTYDNVGTATALALLTHNSSDASLQDIVYGQNSAGTPVVSHEFIYKQPADAHFDGINLWILGSIDQSPDKLTLTKIDISKLHTDALSNDLQLNDIVTGSYVVCDVPNTAGDLNLINVTYDGRDIWILPEPDASQTNSGKIFRLQSCMFRC